jgi:AcrR family transcriptional regulator
MTLAKVRAATPLRKRGAALEDAILAAAFTELSEVGYAQFSVESVAARARTGKASIYRRWPDRLDLIFDALLDQLPSPQECGLEDHFPDDVTTADALRHIAGRIADVLSSPAGDVMRAIKCEAAADPTLAVEIDKRFQGPRRESMLQLLRRGVERGEVRPEAVCPEVADVLPAMIAHRIVLQRLPVTARDVTTLIENVMIPLVEAR